MFLIAVREVAKNLNSCFQLLYDRMYLMPLEKHIPTPLPVGIFHACLCLLYARAFAFRKLRCILRNNALQIVTRNTYHWFRHIFVSHNALRDGKVCFYEPGVESNHLSRKLSGCVLRFIASLSTEPGRNHKPLIFTTN